MIEVLLFTINSIMPLILLMLIGYVLKAKGFFTPEFLKIANKTVFFLFLPVMLFKNIADIEDLAEIRMDVILYIVVIILILFVIGFISALFIKDPKQKGVIHQCIFRSNFALIGVPLAELIGGSQGVLQAAVISLFSIPMFNVMAVVVLSVYKNGSVKLDVKKILLDIVKNPLILGVLLGFAYSFLRGTIGPTPLSRLTFIPSVIGFISRAATPLALLVLGGQFDIKRVSGYKKQLAFGLTGRNFIAPLLGVGVAAVLTFTGVTSFGPEIFAALIALFGTPVAVASAIMAEAMDNDGQLAGQLVVWTSILSLITLFVVIFIIKALGLL